MLPRRSSQPQRGDETGGSELLSANSRTATAKSGSYFGATRFNEDTREPPWLLKATTSTRYLEPLRSPVNTCEFEATTTGGRKRVVEPGSEILTK